MSAALETRLRQALEGTSERPPRPLSPLELPMNVKLEKLLSRKMLDALRPAAVLVPVIRREHELSVLLTVRSENLRSHKGQISFPGGRREPEDASAAAAAMREAEEEVGIPPQAVEVIGYLDDYPTLTGYLVTPVVGVVSGVTALRPCAREVAETFEVPLPFFLEKKHFERKILSREGVNVPFFELNYAHYRIWGATAGMLWNLHRKVAGRP